MKADRAAGRSLTCPVLTLWSAWDDLPRWFAVVTVTGTCVCGRAIAHLAEEAPPEAYEELHTFAVA